MRWLKHLSMAHADEAVSYILEEYGAEGYGIWWLILEDVAAPMEAGKMTPIASHSAVKWSHICHCSVRRFRSIAIRLAEKNLIRCETDIDRIIIEVPNVLKYRDEYSQRSGATPDQDREQIESIKRVDTESLVSPKAQPNGTRLSIEELPERWLFFAVEEMKWDGTHAAKTFSTFRDYWIAQPGQKGRKTDWLATWRNWCRNERQPTIPAVQRKTNKQSLDEYFASEEA